MLIFKQQYVVREQHCLCCLILRPEEKGGFSWSTGKLFSEKIGGGVFPAECERVVHSACSGSEQVLNHCLLRTPISVVWIAQVPP